LPDIREYARWKAGGSFLVEKRVDEMTIGNGIDEVGKNVDKLVSRFKWDLDTYVRAWDQKIWGHLKEVMMKAVNLDMEMNKSRAILSISCWGADDFTEMKFDESTMSSAVGFAAASQGMPVELVLAPPMIKVGTADGESYDRTVSLTKWVVICGNGKKT
jgi:hypothetical protein